MKTLYIADILTNPQFEYEEQYFVIGVKNSYADLENLPKPNTIKKFTEVVNPKYIRNDLRNYHILQPAFVTFHKPKGKQ